MRAGDGQCVGSVDKIMMIDTKYAYINMMNLPSDTLDEINLRSGRYLYVSRLV